MGLKKWLEKRRDKKAAREWYLYERDRLEILALKTTLKQARLNLQYERLQLKSLKKEIKRKRDYIS